MNLKELKKILDEENIPKEMYKLDGGLPVDRYCINQIDNADWEVYYSDRGRKYDLHSFENEEEACKLLYQWLIKYRAGYIKGLKKSQE